MADRLPADRWILSRLAATVAAVHAAWAGYDVTTGTRALMDFVVDDLSNWYVRLSRARFWAPDRAADPAAVATLYEVLVTVARLLAPAAPFASDWIHQALTGSSVHLASFPEPSVARDEPLEAAMDAVRRLASLGRAAREEGGLRVRQPLARMQVAVPAAVRGPLFDQLLPLLIVEVNVRDVAVVASDADLVRLRAKPNFRALGKRYGKRTPAVAAAAAQLAPEQLRELEKGGTATLALPDGDAVFHPEDVVVEREVASEWLVQSERAVRGRARSGARPPRSGAKGSPASWSTASSGCARKPGYDVATRIALWIDGDPAVLDAAAAHADFIRGETLARGLHTGARAPQADLEQETALDDLPVVLGVSRTDTAA